MNKIKNKIETFLALALLVGLGVFGFLKVTAYLNLYEYNDSLSAAITSIQADINASESAVSEGKSVFKDTSNAKNQEISGVFPATEDLNSLTRAFDEFAVDNNFSNNPFFVSSISYKDSTEVDGQYQVLPFTMKVESSQKNFYKFLEYIETSGNLDNQVRLMEVESVSISLGSDDDILSYSLEINAYFQK